MLLNLILENYVPLLSSKITRVELNTQHMINLFISANGSGKTSILKELNPMPPENGNYENGRKCIEFMVGPRRYLLDSYTHVGNGHSFKYFDPGDDVGVECNQSGTYNVQKELVWNYFKLDGALVRFFGGLRTIDRLSGLSTARRKDIVLQVYPNDTDCAMKVYNKLRTERNELKAAIKNQSYRFAEEERKLKVINDIGANQLEHRISQIDEELKQALLIRGKLEGLETDPYLTNMINDFTMLTDRMVINKVSGFIYTERELCDVIDLNTAILERYQDMAMLSEGLISEHAHFLEGIEEFVKDPEAYKEQAAKIKEEIKVVDGFIAEIDEQLKERPLFNDPEQTFVGLETVGVQFIEYLRRVTVCSTAELTGNDYRNLITQRDQLAFTIKDKTLLAADLVHKLKHLQGTELMQCPDCSHEFQPGVAPGEIEQTDKTLRSVNLQLEQAEKDIKELDKRIENDADWFSSMNQLYQWVKSNGHIPVIPELLKAFDVGRVVSQGLENALERYLERFEHSTYRKTLVEEESLLDGRLALLDRQNVMDAAAYVANTEKELVLTNNKIMHYKAKLNALNNQLKTIRTYKEDLARLGTMSLDILRELKIESQVKFRVSVDDRIADLTEDKQHHMTQIIKSKSLAAVVESISSDIARLKRRLLIVDTWADGLCPNKGLLGKLMTDFIRSVTGNVNHALKTIWNSTLYVKPCGKENGDLDYKFPVITGEYKPTPDISDCSGGEGDILDWLFRKTLMTYHAFPFPLIMDEVGPYLDEVKRGRLFSYVHEYTQHQDARQLFLVSHYFNQYGSFNNPNVIALRYEGLTLTGDVNRNSTVI